MKITSIEGMLMYSANNSYNILAFIKTCYFQGPLISYRKGIIRDT